MSDLIDRQAAIDAVRKCQVKEVTPAYMLIDKADVMTELMMLPSAQPERKKGKWIEREEDMDGMTLQIKRCSECGASKPMKLFSIENFEFNFCPNCGASMVRGEEDDPST